MKAKVSAVKCCGYDSGLVFEAVKKAIDLLGGIESFVKPGSKVLVKPNLLMAKGPELAITTHPEIVRSCIKILKGINCRIIVGDGPSVWGKYIENIDSVYETTGIKKICMEEEVELLEFKKRRMREKFPLSALLDECDYLVNLPKFKTHGMTILTGAVKNNFGLVSGTFKTELHKNYFDLNEFAGILVDVYLESRPALTIVDGILAMEGEGPGTSGKPRQVNLLLAGVDCVALDAVMAHIMGMDPLDIATTRIAYERKSGEADLGNIDVIGEPLSEFISTPFLLPLTASGRRKLPKPIVALAKRLLRYYPCVERDNCIECATCIKACPAKAVSMKNGRIAFDYSKCIACFCCQETCPESAIKVKKSLLLKLFGL